MTGRVVSRGIGPEITGGMIMAGVISNIVGDNSTIIGEGTMGVGVRVGTNRSLTRRKLHITLTTIRVTPTSNIISSTRHRVTSPLLMVTSSISVKITKFLHINTISTIVKRGTRLNSNTKTAITTITTIISATLTNSSSSRGTTIITAIRVGTISTIIDKIIITIDWLCFVCVRGFRKMQVGLRLINKAGNFILV